MAFVIADRVRESSTTTGTGNFTLGGAITGYQTFDAVLDSGDTTYYTIADQGGADWEVGIGTFTSPSTLARTTILSSSNGGSVVTFTAGTKDVFISLPASKTNTNDQPNVISVNSTSNALRITQTGTGNALVVEDSANPDSSPFVVDASGNVGIGTTTPTAPLDVNGSVAITGTARRITGDFSNATQTNRIFFQTTTSGGGTSVGAIPNATGGNSAFNAFGSPDPANSSFAQLRAGADTSDVRLTSGITGTGTYYPLTFYTGGTERMRIDSSGNVGIGTSSPSSKLEVDGLIRARAIGGEGGQIDINNPSNTSTGMTIDVDNANSGRIYLVENNSSLSLGQLAGTGGLIKFFTAASERARITSGGDFLVNATALPAGTHGVAGTIYTQGFYANYGIGSHSGVGGAYQANAINFQWNGSAVRLWVDTTDLGGITVSSDYRVKKDIKTQAATALDRVLQIRPVTYTYADYAPFSWKADGVSREGFIAHELAAIIPSAVEGEKDEPNKVQSLKLDALCSVLVKAIQELKAEFDAYKAAHP